MKNTLALRNSQSGKQHVCAFDMLETYINQHALSAHFLKRWENRLADMNAAAAKFFAILSGDRKLALLLGAVLVSALIEITLLIAFTTYVAQ